MYLTPSPSSGLTGVYDPFSAAAPRRTDLPQTAFDALWAPMPNRGTFAINGQTLGTPSTAAEALSGRSWVSARPNEAAPGATSRGLVETKSARPDGVDPGSVPSSGYKVGCAPVDTRLGLAVPRATGGVGGVGPQLAWGLGTSLSKVNTGELPWSRPLLAQRDQLVNRVPVVYSVDEIQKSITLGARSDLPRQVGPGAPTFGAGQPEVRAEARPGYELPSRPPMNNERTGLYQYPAYMPPGDVGAAKMGSSALRVGNANPVRLPEGLPDQYGAPTVEGSALPLADRMLPPRDPPGVGEDTARRMINTADRKNRY